MFEQSYSDMFIFESSRKVMIFKAQKQEGFIQEGSSHRTHAKWYKYNTTSRHR
jgi:hypothetical protein